MAKKPSKKRYVTKKTSVHAPEAPKSLPPLTEAEAQAYMMFSNGCKKVYEKFFKFTIDDRVAQNESTHASLAMIRFMVMMHDLLEVYGVMQFNRYVSPTLYEYLDEVQDKTGQKLPLARVMLDGVKSTKMELLSGVTVHPLPEFEEPEYKIVTPKKRRVRS